LWKYGIPPVNIDDPNNIYSEIARYKSSKSVRPIDAKLKVTMLIGTLGPGGSERQAVHLALELQKRDIEVEFLTTQTLEGSTAHYLPLLNEYQVPVISVSGEIDLSFDYSKSAFFRSTGALPTALCSSYGIASRINSSQPDIVHCWLDETNIWGAVASILTRTPGIVMSTRSVNPTHFSKKSGWTKRWYRSLLSNRNIAIVSNSEAGARDYAKWLRVELSRFQVINNGLTTNHYNPSNTENAKGDLLKRFGLKKTNEIILGVMRFTEEKRPLLFIKTCLLILKSRPLSITILVGEGPMLEQISKVVEKSGMKHRIILLGTSREISKLMEISDLLILTSRFEGSPNVLIEAQNSGCPVLTTAAGGAVETIVDGVTGFIVPDKPVRIAQKACAILEDKILKSSLAAAGPPFVAANFSMDKMVRQTLKLYHRVLNSP